MYASTDAYYDRTKMMDLRLVSTLGLSETDAEAVRAVDGVLTVQRAYSADMLLAESDGDTIVSKLHSIPAEDEWLNRADLVEGRMPENSGECVIEFNPSLSSLQIAVGDTLVVAGENVAPEEKLAVNELTVVGRVESSCYFSIEKERSTVGNGSVALIVYGRRPRFCLRGLHGSVDSR